MRAQDVPEEWDQWRDQQCLQEEKLRVTLGAEQAKQSNTAKTKPKTVQRS